MELYELLARYGKGKGEAVMWESTRLVSDYIKPMKEANPKEYWSLMRQIYGLISGTIMKSLLCTMSSELNTQAKRERFAKERIGLAIRWKS